MFLRVLNATFNIALADMIATPTVDGRRAKIDNITRLLAAAANGFGSNVTYQIGDGPLMF
jgi:hypothetical protein